MNSDTVSEKTTLDDEETKTYVRYPRGQKRAKKTSDKDLFVPEVLEDTWELSVPIHARVFPGALL